MSADSTSLLVLANSARAIAESAHRGGYRVTVLDGYSDQDTQLVADCWPVTQGFANLDVDIFTEEIGALIPDHPCGVIYGAGLEEAPALLRRLSRCCRLLGNDPSVLELLHRPRRFFSLLDRLKIPHPEVCYTTPCSATGRHWLIKRAGSCGGQGVAYYTLGDITSDNACYYQKYTPGQAMSVLFIANGSTHRTIGYNLLGTSGSLHSAPFLYKGAIAHASLQNGVCKQIDSIVCRLISELGLRGINSLDFIHNAAGIFVIDLNPRPTATLELYEHLMPGGWIKQHIVSCQGALPTTPLVSSPEIYGHEILYASRNLLIPSNLNWPTWVKDRPGGGSVIKQGEPLCSLFAQGESVTEVETMLRWRRDDMMQILDSACYQPPLRKVAV